MQREHLDARAVRSEDSGFTLIELMMVIVIIAILIAVLMPVVLGASNRARDRATESSLHNALSAAKVVYGDHAKYSDANIGSLTAASGAGSVQYVDNATQPTSQNTVSFDPVTDSYIVLSARSKTGSCFYIADNAGGTGTLYAKLPAAGGCDSGSAPPVGDVAWKTAW